MPGEAVFVEGGPEEAEAEGAGGEHGGKDAAAHEAAGGVLVVEGAEGDAGRAHAGSGGGEGEEERLVEQRQAGGGDGERGGQLTELDPSGGAGLGGDAGERGRQRQAGLPERDAASDQGEDGSGGGEAGEHDGGVDGGGEQAAAEAGGIGIGDGQRGGARLELGLGFAVGSGRCERRRGRLGGAGGGVEPEGSPLRRGGAGGFGVGGGGGDLGGVDLEDAELAVEGRGGGFVAQRAFGETRAGLARGDQLAGKLDEIGGQRDGRAGGLLEDGGLAEGDLLVEGAGVDVVAVGLAVGVADGGCAGRQRDVGGGAGVLVEADGEGSGVRGLRVGLGGGELSVVRCPLSVARGVAGNDGMSFMGSGERGLDGVEVGPEVEFGGRRREFRGSRFGRSGGGEIGREFLGGGVVIEGVVVEGDLIEGGLVERLQQGLLGGGEALGVAGGDLGGGAGLLDGAFGLFGEVGAVGLGAGVALGDGGGDAGRAGGGGGGPGCGRGCGGRVGTAVAVGGEALGDLEAKVGGPGAGGG